jgi:non-canonical poly(A) RNA polymerase PAPD5/7
MPFSLSSKKHVVVCSPPTTTVGLQKSVNAYRSESSDSCLWLTMYGNRDDLPPVLNTPSPVMDDVGDDLEEDFVELDCIDTTEAAGSDIEDNNDVEVDRECPAQCGNDSHRHQQESDSKTGSSAIADIDALTAVYDRLKDLPPWMGDFVNYRQVNPLVALHNEIVSFCKLMEPRKEEMKERQELVDRFTALAHSVFDVEGCKVQVFGSQATGLCLPTSDIDIAIQIEDVQKGGASSDGKSDSIQTNGTNQSKGVRQDVNDDTKKTSKRQELVDMENWDQPSGTFLQRLATKLREEWLEDLSYLEVIEKTRVPLVKFTHGPTGISVDVCFNQKTGPQAAALMHQYMEALPPLRPLTFVLKKFMSSRGLNQPYTGGVGSFLLQMMIVSFLQHRERDSRVNRRPSVHNLGALIVEFFEFYSTDFNFILTGMSVRFDGFFFPKGAVDRKKDFWMPQRPFSIAMENPLEPTHDAGTPSFRIGAVQRAFEVAFKTLLCYVSEPLMPTVSTLASILQPSDEMWLRAGRTLPPTKLTLSTATPSDSYQPPRKRQRR